MKLLCSILLCLTVFKYCDAQQGCISTGQEYWTSFTDSASEDNCVSTGLLTTIQGPCDCDLNGNKACSDYLSTYSTSSFAWVSGNANLEEYLKSGFNIF